MSYIITALVSFAAGAICLWLVTRNNKAKVQKVEELFD